MRAIEIAGGRLLLADRPVPEAGHDEVLIRVHAAGLNRADIHQTRGDYGKRAGFPDIPGLEVAGEVIAVGSSAGDWRVGDRVCALLAGGGYAEMAVAPAGQCLPLPAGLSMAEGAALPEAAFTCWATVVEEGRLAAGETVLIHGGASGIGTFAIQLARLLGARVIVTAGSAEKCARCRETGADMAIDYRAEDFVPAVLAATGGKGCDLVLDMVAGDYVARNIEALAPLGRHVTIGVMGGSHLATIPIDRMLAKRLTLSASTLRGRSLDEKRRLRDALLDKVWPWVETGQLRPVVHATFPLEAAGEAQAALATSRHFGKIVLDIGGAAR